MTPFRTSALRSWRPYGVPIVLMLIATPSHAQWSASAEIGLSDINRHPTLTLPDMHICWQRAFRPGLDLSGGFSWDWDHRRVYDLIEADVNFDVVLGSRNFLGIAPRVGFSTVLINDRVGFDGKNVGLMLHHWRHANRALRMDAAYRYFPGYRWFTLSVGVEGL